MSLIAWAVVRRSAKYLGTAIGTTLGHNSQSPAIEVSLAPFADT